MIAFEPDITTIRDNKKNTDFYSRLPAAKESIEYCM
jgi:hypothetical protein